MVHGLLSDAESAFRESIISFGAIGSLKIIYHFGPTANFAWKPHWMEDHRGQ